MARKIVVWLVALVVLVAGSALAEQVTLQFLWPEYTPEKVRFGQHMVQEFEKAHPNIKIEMIRTNSPAEKLSVMAAGGTAPDIGWMGAGWKGIKDLWMPLDRFIARDGGEIDTGDFIAPVWNSYNVEGKHYALPLGFTATVMYNNLDLINEAGMGAPGQDWTWDEFVQYAKKLTIAKNGAEPTQYGVNLYQGGDYWPLLYYDGALWNEDATKARFNTPIRVHMLELRRALQFDQGVHATPAAINANGGHQPAFLTGFTAMYAGGSWALEPVRQGADFDWDIAPFPIVNFEGKAYRGTGIWPEEMWISASTKHPEEAWTFIKFAASKEQLSWAASEGHVVPGRLSVGGSDAFLNANARPKHIEAFIRSGEMGTVYMDHPEGGRMVQEFAKYLSKALYDQNDPMPAKSAALEIDRVIQGILDEYNAKEK